MNEHTRNAIDRARLVVKGGPDPSSEFYRAMSVFINPGVLTTLCDALEASAARVADLEADRAAVADAMGIQRAGLGDVEFQALLEERAAALAAQYSAG